MCDSDPPAPPPAQEPQVLVNPFDDLDDEERMSAATRRGTALLRIPLNTGLGIGFSGRGGSSSPSGANPARSTGLSLAGSPPSPSKPNTGYVYGASTEGLGHTAQQRQRQQDDEFARRMMMGAALSI